MPNLVERTGEESLDTLAIMTDAHEGDESENLAAGKSYDSLERLPADAFDHIMAMAADIFDAPIAVVRVANRDHLWCQSQTVAGQLQDDYPLSFSAFTRPSPESLSAVNKTNGTRSLSMPLVAIEHGLRFYVSTPLRTPEGFNVGTLCVVDREPRLVHERQIRHLKALAAIVMDQMEARLSALRAGLQAEILASETDHRVMNSLQFVSDILTMQSRSLRGTEAADRLRIAANRVSAVARVHRHFSIHEDAQNVPILAYLRRLCGDLSGILDTEIEVTGTEANVPSKQILAIGFSVNELVSNAKKYGAAPIKVSFTANAAGQYELCVTDAGTGLPDGFVFGQNGSNGLGMKVVMALVTQLAGHLSVSVNPAGHRACFTITFPPAENEQFVGR